VRVAAVAFVALVVVSAVFVWQAMNGPVSLGGLLTPRLEAMINSGLKDMQVRFGDSVIEWSEGKNLAYLQFIDVEALDLNGNVIARVPRAKLSLSGPALLRGDVAPTRVELVGVNALLVRRADGGVQLGFQVADQKPGKAGPDEPSEGVIKAVLEAMLTPKPDDMLSRYLTRFAVSDAKLTIFDEDTRSYWNAEKAALTFDRKTDGVVVSVAAPLRLADKSSWLFTASANYTNGSDNVALQAAFKPVRLSVLAASGAGLKALKGIDIPVQGNASCNLSMAGSLGACKLVLSAGDGHLQLPALKKDPIHIKSAALTVDVDVPGKRYAIQELNWKGDTLRGNITGGGAFAFATDGALAGLTADWTAENVFIDAPIMFDGGGLALEKAKFRGTFDAAREHLTIDEILAHRGAFQLTLTGELQDNPVSTGVVLNGGFKDLSIDDLKRLWPQGAAVGAREWIMANAHEGLIREGTVAVNIPAGAVTGEQIPNEMMNITFSMEGMRMTYLDGLPDATKVKGTATVLGDTFKAQMTGGNIGTVTLKEGSFTIDEFHKRGAIGTVNGVIAGPTADILAILDKPRLGYPTRYGIKPSEAGGKAEGKFNFIIPMLRDVKTEDIDVNVEAEMKDIRLPINETLKLTGGTFLLKLDMKGMKAHGAVQVNTAPMGFTWTEDFTGASKTSTRLDVTGTLNEEQRARLGIDMRPYVQGKSAIVATFTGNGGKIQNAKVDANLTSARLSSPELDWAKPEDAKASMKADVVFRPDGSVEVNNIDAVGQGLKAQGRLVVAGGRIREADFKRLQLGERNDFAIVHKIAADGSESIDVKGRVMDAGGFLGDEDDEDEAKLKDKERKHPLAIKADLDLAYLQGDVWFTGVTYAYADDGQRITAFKIDASADAANVRGEMIRAPDNSRKLRLQTADAGRLLRATTGFRSLIGGDLSLSVDLSPLPPAGSPASKAESTFDGTLKIENFKIVDQPFFARLLSAGSFTGLDDLLRGEGISFTRMEQVFQGRGDVITLTNGRAAGPAIGLTTQGLVNRDTDRLDLNGTIVPLYGLNSMFEDIPLLGDILNSRKGEGIFGVTYGITGELKELRVAVNPVSVLAPGFLRKLFQMGPTPQAAAPMPAPMPTPKPEAQNAAQPALQPTKVN
jgi:hypothetical protein